MRRQTCPANDARARLPELIDDAVGGTTTIITRRGTPLAAIVPLAAVPPEGRGSLLALEGTGAGLWGDDVAETLDAMRREWA